MDIIIYRRGTCHGATNTSSCRYNNNISLVVNPFDGVVGTLAGRKRNQTDRNNYRIAKYNNFGLRLPTLYRESSYSYNTISGKVVCTIFEWRAARSFVYIYIYEVNDDRYSSVRLCEKLTPTTTPPPLHTLYRRVYVYTNYGETSKKRYVELMRLS